MRKLNFAGMFAHACKGCNDATRCGDAGLRISSRMARLRLGRSRVFGVIVRLRHTSEMVATTPLDPYGDARVSACMHREGISEGRAFIGRLFLAIICNKSRL